MNSSSDPSTLAPVPGSTRAATSAAESARPGPAEARHPDSRIARRFAALRQSGEMGLVAYLTAGDPSLAATEQFVLALAGAGADVIELGVPFSDPVADGPVIQRASERALQVGTTLAGVIALVQSLRARTDVPLVVFSYYNPVLQMGLEKFAEAAAAAGADGVLITDVTPEEGAEYRATMRARGLDTVFLVAPTSTDERLALGFGISLPGHVAVLGGLADAAVVGSALVEEIERAPTVADAAAALAARVRLLKGAATTGMSRREPA